MDIKENFSCCGMFNPHFFDNCDVTINKQLHELNKMLN